MLQAINDRIKGWLGILVVVLIGLPFALWGIQSYLDDSGPRYAAKVNKIEISSPELEYTISLQRQKLLRQYNGKLPFDEKTLRKQVLEQLINQRLLESISYDEGYRISDSVLAGQIKQLFTINGQFDREAMDARLAAMGRTPSQFEYELRNELRVQQYQAGIANTAIVTNEMVNQLASLEQQLRDVTILTFNADKFAGDYQPAEEEIKQYYEANSQRFMKPEKVKVDYVEISTSDLTDEISVDESQIDTMYTDYLASIANREERKARHILIPAGNDTAGKEEARKKIADIQKQLKEGADFSELAKKYSQDTVSAENGGDLGWVSAGDMVKPFEDTLFALKKGELSDIVETRFGFHLIQLDDIRSEKPEPLAVKRLEFEEELRNEAAASRFYDLSENLANKAYENPDSLDEIVESMGLKLKTSDYFTRTSGKGIAENEKVRNIAFSKDVLEQGINSDVIELTPTHIAVIRLNDHLEAAPLPLDEVRSKIEAALKTKSGYQKTLDAALAVKKKLEVGESVDNILTDGITVDKPGAVSRRDFTKVSDPSLISKIFEMQAPVDDKPVIRKQALLTGDIALIVLNKVILPENLAQDKLDLTRSELRRQIATDEFLAVLKAMKSEADIDVNKRALGK